MSLMENTEQYWKINKKWPKRIFWLIFVLSLLCVLLLPGYGGYINRARVSEVLILLQAPRASVEEQLIENPNSKITLDAQILIPKEISLRSEEGERIEIAYREISESGQIRVFSPQLGVMLVLTPTVGNGEINWSCWGSPKKIVPTICQ